MAAPNLVAARRLALAPALLLLAGCATRTYPVQGQVVWADGTPATELAGGQVVFESAALKTSARGDIRQDGGFRLSTFQSDDGVPAGEYRVLVLEHRPAPEGRPVPPEAMHLKFSDFATSGITASVFGPTPVTVTVERSGKARRAGAKDAPPGTK